ncbi:hypothetical protein LPB136_13290 [Tenacibaculum todarodis]|uniref:Uncharacterized protein n=1 Tax=Tenacibaculum todarodis TaxID=1850252 RepID=A0A1L3JMC0_9FLAO|nr:hypothetical protein [Tenacibaculum todarodis]APG66287.1 hypothetical protein LPB136_13290 [Tenacibaculum todarodis]
MKKIIHLLLLTIFIFPIYGQNSDKILDRLKAIKNKDIILYNIDGIDFTSQTFSNNFSKKGLKKIFKKYSIRKKDVKIKDGKLVFNNLHISKTKKISENLTQNNSYYFVENKNKRVTVFWFGSINKEQKKLERQLIQLIINNELPKKTFHQTKIDSIDFVGRKIKLGNGCYWTNINTIQCPYKGEMNWSIHKNLKSAEESIQYQLAILKAKKGGKITSEEILEIKFEGTLTKSKKIIYDFTGTKSLLAGISGGKNLTVFYVATKIRENYISCVLSFWNNDQKTKTGLVPLLDEVIILK